MAGKWRTHNRCCDCKEEFLKTELIDGALCKTCKAAADNKKMVLSRSDKEAEVKVVTKRKACRCFNCGKTINAGEKAVTYRYEAFFHNNNFGNLHLSCAEIID